VLGKLKDEVGDALNRSISRNKTSHRKTCQEQMQSKVRNCKNNVYSNLDTVLLFNYICCSLDIDILHKYTNLKMSLFYFVYFNFL